MPAGSQAKRACPSTRTLDQHCCATGAGFWRRRGQQTTWGSPCCCQTTAAVSSQVSCLQSCRCTLAAVWLRSQASPAGPRGIPSCCCCCQARDSHTPGEPCVSYWPAAPTAPQHALRGQGGPACGRTLHSVWQSNLQYRTKLGQCTGCSRTHCNARWSCDSVQASSTRHRRRISSVGRAAPRATCAGGALAIASAIYSQAAAHAPGLIALATLCRPAAPGTGAASAPQAARPSVRPGQGLHPPLPVAMQMQRQPPPQPRPQVSGADALLGAVQGACMPSAAKHAEDNGSLALTRQECPAGTRL